MKGLKDSFSNDLYFENEIKTIEKNNNILQTLIWLNLLKEL